MIYIVRTILLSASGAAMLFTVGYLFGNGLWKTGLLVMSIPFWIIFFEMIIQRHHRIQRLKRRYEVYATKD